MPQTTKLSNGHHQVRFEDTEMIAEALGYFSGDRDSAGTMGRAPGRRRSQSICTRLNRRPTRYSNCNRALPADGIPHTVHITARAGISMEPFELGSGSRVAPNPRPDVTRMLTTGDCWYKTSYLAVDASHSLHRYTCTKVPSTRSTQRCVRIAYTYLHKLFCLRGSANL